MDSSEGGVSPSLGARPPINPGDEADLRFDSSYPNNNSQANSSGAVKRQFCCFLALLLLCPVPTQEGTAGTNSELVPGSRIVFPYYDLRPGLATFLLFTNVSLAPVSVRLEFYDVTCLRRDSSLSLSGVDIDLLDVSSVLRGDSSGTFRQGFVDAVAGDNVLMGTALIVNIMEDWAILYHGAAARRQPGGAMPFEPYPSRLFLPGFLTPGSLGEVGFTDGLLVLAAPHPTQPGGELPEQPIHAAFQTFLKKGGTTSEVAFQSVAKDGSPISGGVVGHQVIIPIGQITGSLPPPTLGWLSVTNNAVDESGKPFGLVGLYLQTVIGGGNGIGVATRLWGDPAAASSP